MGVRTIGMPDMTHFLGPAVIEGEGAAVTRWLKRSAITRDLMHRLPPVLRYWQKFHRGVTDALPFQSERFNTHVQFTFEVAPAPEAALWSAMRDKTRNVIRKAQKQYEVQDLHDPDEFVAFYRSNLQSAGRTQWEQAGMMPELLAAALDRRAGAVYGIRDEPGGLVAAIFCARDAKSSYYSLSTRRIDAQNGAIPLLIWHAMRQAASKGLLFDFDGISKDSAISFYAGFGGVTSPRYVAVKSVPGQVLRKIGRRLGWGMSTFGS